MEKGCTSCPYAGHIELKECPNAYTEKSRKCGFYDSSPLTKGIGKQVLDRIYEVFEELQALPKPAPSQIGGTYYGGTQLFSSVGSHCDLLQGEAYTSYGYGCNIDYKAIYGIRLGGAYKTDIIDKLTSLIDECREELVAEGWSIIKDYGTNYSVYGIAER